MRYLLKTDTCIYVINERPAKVLQAFRRHEGAGPRISSTTAAERNLSAPRQFLAPLTVAPFDAAAAEVFGSLRAWLQSQGMPIGPYDTQIAAHAHALGVTLVSNNTREFARVQGLRVENWAA